MLAAAVLAGALVTGSSPDRGVAETAPKLAAQAEALRRSESAALLQLYAAESALARAHADVDELEARSTALARDEERAQLRTTIVRRALRTSQARVATLLRSLYIVGQPDPIAVILGATSLDEAVAGIDGLSRATALNKQLAIQAEQRARGLDRLRTELARRRDRLDAAREAARAGATRLASAVVGRRTTIATLQRRQSLTTQRLAALQSRARDAEARSAVITEALTTRAATPAQPAAARRRQQHRLPSRRQHRRQRRSGSELSSSMPSRTIFPATRRAGFPSASV